MQSTNKLSDSYDIGLRSGLLDQRHMDAMGMSVWLYMWLIRKATKNKGGVSLVLGGRPIKHDDCADMFTLRTYKRYIEILRQAGYIETKRTAYGLIITITKGKKVFESAQKRSATSGTSEGREVPHLAHPEVPRLAHLGTKSGTSNKRTQLENNNTYKNCFDSLAAIIQPKARYSESYAKLTKKAMKSLTADELLVSAEFFVGKFNGGSDWHTQNKKYCTLAQFFGNTKDRIPRYELNFTEAMDAGGSKPKITPVSVADYEEKQRRQVQLLNERNERISQLAGETR